MLPTQQQFNQLSQLDRIEYRQRRDNILQIGRSNPLLPLCYGFLFLLSISLIILSNQPYNQYYHILYHLSKGLFLYFFIFAIIVQLALKVIRKKQLKQLYDEYYIISLRKPCEHQENQVKSIDFSQILTNIATILNSSKKVIKRNINDKTI